MEPMTDNQRLQLQNMIKANNVEDQTNLIRNLKHSDLLKNDINALILLKAKSPAIQIRYSCFGL